MGSRDSLANLMRAARMTLELAAEHPDRYVLPAASPFPDVATAYRAAVEHVDAAATILAGIARLPLFAVGDRVDILSEADEDRVLKRELTVVDVSEGLACVRDATGAEEDVLEILLRHSR